MPQSSAATFATGRPKPRQTDFRTRHEFEVSPYTVVPVATLRYSASGRIRTLAQPKIRQDTTIRNDFSRDYHDPTYSGVSRGAAQADCSDRLSELAKPVPIHKDHTFEYPSPRPISRGALKYHASTKIQELAIPRKPASAR